MTDLLPKFKFYQDIRLWPKDSDFDYEGWLDNFSRDEQEIAQKILDFFVYFPDDIIDQMFRTVVGRAGYFFKKYDSTWNNESFHNNCWYSYVPGEVQNISDSGYIYTRKVREILGVPQERLKDFDKLVLFLNAATTPQNVILTDDFVGTGHQCNMAWNNNLFTNLPTLKQIVKSKGHRVIYVPLIVNERGKNCIEGLCEGLKLGYAYHMGLEWNLFVPDCLCWKGDMGLFNASVALIKEKSKSIGIKDDNSVCSVRGYGGQGLALGFSHGIPDACPGFFFKEADNWVPLKKKHLKRG
ncbi:MAG: hypothetical protein K6F78_05255 [Bacteroidaceae bacterium]|nr:hypothetical protein [Bacteroidaceae bacterium]